MVLFWITQSVFMDVRPVKLTQAINFPMFFLAVKIWVLLMANTEFLKGNFSNLFVTIANQMGVETRQFADSDGELSSLLA